MKKFTTTFLCLVVLWLCPKIAAQRSFVHPGIPFTQSDLNQLKANISQEPWKSGYQALANDSRSSLNYGMKGPFQTVSRAPNLNNTAWIQDMVAIHNLTFMWIFTGNDAYAAKATQMLDSWAVTNTSWGGTENLLDIGDYISYVVPAADILKSLYVGWTAANTTNVNNYFANVLYPTSGVPYPLRDNNKGALQLKTALSIAAFLDDETKWNNAIEGFRVDAGGGLRCSLPNGQLGDAGRDDHWYVQAEALMWCAEVAWKQGVDMFAELDNRLFAIGELYNRYAFEGNSLAFIPFGGYAAYWTNWGIAPGVRHQGPFNNIVKGAYAVRKAMPTPWTEMMREAVGEGALSFLFLKSEDNSTAMSLSPIVFPATELVDELSNMDIGNTGISGSASYENGNWSIHGAGTSVANSVNYTFKPIQGDFCIVAKIENSAISSGTSGLMLRETLGASGKNISLNLYNGTVNTRYNGNVIGYTHYTPKAPWWLKMERVGQRIFSYHSADGIHWSNHNQVYEATSNEAYIGLFTLSNNTSALNSATFSNVAITNTTPVGAPVITSAKVASATVGVPFSYSIQAGGSATAFSAVGLPAGLTLDSSTGIISGTLSTVGTYAIAMKASSSNGADIGTLVLTVNGADAPSAPSGVVASVVNVSQVKLTWTASEGASSYSVSRSLTEGGPYDGIQSNIIGTTFIDAIPVPEVSNYYVVTAITGDMESIHSFEVSASVPPAIPVAPEVVNKNNQIDLSWPAASGASAYNVKRSSTMGGPYITVANVSSTNYSDVNVVNGNPYYYVVSSVGAKYESGNSVEVFGVPGSNSVTWKYLPGSGLWSESVNWVENTPPVSPSIVTFKATEDSVSINDLNDIVVSRIIFGADANSYSIEGSQIALGNSVVNNSPKAQSIKAPLLVNSDVTIDVNAQSVALSGVVSGSGGVVRKGSGTLYVSGNNTYSGNTIVSGSAGTWPPTNAIAIAGIGTGTPSSPTSGPLGTGVVVMNGGALYSSGGDATLYNDIEIVSGKTSRFFQTTNAITLYGRLIGNGTIWQDGNTYAGLHMNGDNSEFTGTFVCALRSGNNRLRFNVPQSGSAKAYWNLDANGIDCQSLNFPTGTIHFGALAGRGYFRNNAGGAPVMSIGALNISTWFGGTINGTIGVEKVGTANLEFTGNHTYSSPTSVRSGRFLLNNNASTGVFNSHLTVCGGAFGGTGRTSGTVTVGTGSGTGASLEPGNLAVGTLATSATLTLNQDATYTVEFDFSAGVSDKMIAGNVVLNDAQLSLVEKVAGALTVGTNFTIIDNSGNSPVTGMFKNLPEMAIVSDGEYEFRITYKGGNGNDVVLLDNRAITNTVPIVLQNLTETALSSSQIKLKWDASPASDYVSGYTVKRSEYSDGTYSVISAGLKNNEFVDNGLTAETTYYYKIFATNFMGDGVESAPLMATTRSVTAPLVPVNLKAQPGPGLVWLNWSSAYEATSYSVKRSTVPDGPYTTIANVTDTIYKDATAVNGTTYYYVVSGVNALYESNDSEEVVSTPSAKAWSYWPFDEDNGAVATDVWSGRNATVYDHNRVAGILNYAVRLDGTASSYMQMPNGFVNTLNDFTVSVWVKIDAHANWARIWDFGRGTTHYMFLASNTGGATKPVRFAIKAGGSEQVINCANILPVGAWTHIVVTKSGNTGVMYINGTEVGRNTSMTISPSSLGDINQNYVGKSQYTSDAIMKGAVDEMQIYNVALTATEVTGLYNMAIPGTPAYLTASLAANKVELQWNPVFGATGYSVKRATVPGGPYTAIANGIATRSYTDEAVSEGVYYYVVTATANGFEGTVSNEASITIGTATGINKKEEPLKWDVFPNPVKDNLAVRFYQDTTKPILLQLIDLNGQVKQVVSIDSGSSISVNVSNLPAGVFFIKIEGQSGLKKIIKL